MTVSNIPAHVPAGLVRDFDFYDMKDESDVYAHFKKLHAGPDVFYTPRNGGHWIVTRYADMEHILSNAADFSSRRSTVPPPPVAVTLLESDGQVHDEFQVICTEHQLDWNKIEENLTAKCRLHIETY